MLTCTAPSVKSPAVFDSSRAIAEPGRFARTAGRFCPDPNLRQVAERGPLARRAHPSWRKRSLEGRRRGKDEVGYVVARCDSGERLRALDGLVERVVVVERPRCPRCVAVDACGRGGSARQPDARVGRGERVRQVDAEFIQRRVHERGQGEEGVHVRDLRPRLHRREQRPARRRAPHEERGRLLQEALRAAGPHHATNSPAVHRDTRAGRSRSYREDHHPAQATHPPQQRREGPSQRGSPAPAEDWAHPRKHARAEDRPRAGVLRRNQTA